MFDAEAEDQGSEEESKSWVEWGLDFIDFRSSYSNPSSK